jgi:hypothetical protein
MKRQVKWKTIFCCDLIGWSFSVKNNWKMDRRELPPGASAIRLLDESAPLREARVLFRNHRSKVNNWTGNKKQYFPDPISSSSLSPDRWRQVDGSIITSIFRYISRPKLYQLPLNMLNARTALSLDPSWQGLKSVNLI